MTKAAIVVLADTETIESLGRVVNAMKAVEEYKSKPVFLWSGIITGISVIST